jgi:hypothetical protein
MASKPLKMTTGELEVAEVVVRELRKAMRARSQVFLYFHLDPWLPKGCRGLTVVASADTSCRRYEVEDAR